MAFVKPNKTKIATPNDVVMTKKIPLKQLFNTLIQLENVLNLVLAKMLFMMFCQNQSKDAK